MKIKILSAMLNNELYLDGESGKHVPYMFYQIQVNNESPKRMMLPIYKLVDKTEEEIKEMILKQMLPNDKVDNIPNMVGKEFEI